MFRVRDATAIGKVGTYQKKQADILENALIKLKKDVNEVLNSYDDAGARALVASFQEGIDNYKQVVTKIKNYGIYQESIFNHDSENVSKANKAVATIQNTSFGKNTDVEIEPLVEDNDSDISKQVLNLENIVGDDNNA